AGQPRTDRGVEQRVPGRVEVHLVDPVAVPVVCAQHRRVPVGLLAPPLRLLATGELAETVQLVEVPPGALALDGGQQHRVGGDVVTNQRRWLVGHDVRHVRDATPAPPPAPPSARPRPPAPPPPAILDLWCPTRGAKSVMSWTQVQDRRERERGRGRA